MDLALEFGLPAELLARTLTEREFRRWLTYSQTRALPTKRIELYLAQIAQFIAATMGGAKNTSISDFLISLEPVKVYSNDDVAELQQAFGYAPRKRK